MTPPQRMIVLIGLMGAGKTSIGRKLADRLGLPFVDADEEIVKAADLSIPDIFEIYGEQEFRAGEERVIKRLLRGKAKVLATGGGAFMNPRIRGAIAARGLSVWLKADLDVLVRRTARRTDRPLLSKGDPETILGTLMNERYPVYAGADVIVKTGNESVNETLERIIKALDDHPLVAEGTAEP